MAISSQDNQDPRISSQSKRKWALIANKLVQQSGSISAAQQQASRYVKPALKKVSSNG